ncbi:MAG: hypothetical protein HS126_03070 [Anaerolineales bacterium]|nr:hypothetical protein [Anaerolineales bacterium]
MINPDGVTVNRQRGLKAVGQRLWFTDEWHVGGVEAAGEGSGQEMSTIRPFPPRFKTVRRHNRMTGWRSTF